MVYLPEVESTSLKDGMHSLKHTLMPDLLTCALVYYCRLQVYLVFSSYGVRASPNPAG